MVLLQMDQKKHNFDIKWDDDKVSRLWDYYSAHLQENQYFSSHSGQHILRFLIKWIDFNNVNILDFGCGPGHMIKHLLAFTENSTIHGLDFSSASVATVNKKFKNNRNFAGAVCAGHASPHIHNIRSFQTESMDVVICIEVIEHLNDEQLKSTFKEVYRLLKPGGQFVITTPNEEDLEASKTICPECGCIFHRWQHVRPWDDREIKKWLEKYGFKIKVVFPCFFRSKKAELLNWVISFLKRVLGKRGFTKQPHLLAIAEKHV